MSTNNRAAKQKRHSRTCNTKRGHDTRQAAQDALTHLCRSTGANPAKYEIYHCHHCRKWHFGHHIGGRR